VWGVKNLILVGKRVEAQVWNNEQVLQEMQAFLRALESYPDRFASDPTITFEQHRSNLIPVVGAISIGA
jgi:predicted RNase H-like nuclease